MNNKLVEQERYNKALLQKVKELNEEKTKVQSDEFQRREDIVIKCEEFKKDVVTKFETTDSDTIRKENDNLREKLEEYKMNTKLIHENLESQLVLKEKQNSTFEEDFKNQISSKFEELSSQTDKFQVENRELKKELNVYSKKFEQMNTALSKFHNMFDSGKKEYEKKANEIIKLTRENKELRSKDIQEFLKENENTKLELELIVNSNKELQEKIKKLKEEINNK